MNVPLGWPPRSQTAQKQLVKALYATELYLFARSAFSIAYPGEAFRDNWHIETMCFELDELIRGRNRRLVINLPPRHLKSYCAAIALPAFALGINPSMRIIVATYSQDLGNEHGARLRRLMNSKWYQEIFPQTRLTMQNQDEIQTTKGGARRNVSPRSSTTGFGADVIIIDDLINATDIHSDVMRRQAIEFYQSALHSRQNSQETGSIVSIQQRLHEDDFPNFLLEQGSFRHINLKAIAESRETFRLYKDRSLVRQAGDLLFADYQSRNAIDDIQMSIGRPTFSAQYQQNPVPPEGALIRMDKLQFHDEDLDPVNYEYVLQSWDTAYSSEPGSDFSVCATWGHKNECWHLIDIWRERVAFPDLVAAVKRQKRQWHASTVIVEAIGTGSSLIQQFKSEDSGYRSWLVASKPKGDKAERVSAQTARLESGKFLFPAGDPAWKQELFREMRAFPNGRHDDQVDSITQAIKHIVSRNIMGDDRADPPRRTFVRRPGGRRPWQR